LKEVYEQFQTRCDEKKISLIFDVPANLRTSVVHSDQGMLLKILGHLLDNAIKFTNKGAVTFGVSNTKDVYTFFVSDTGAGISKEAYSTIFNHFVQEDNSNTRAYEGSGLGLSIVNGLVTLLGGTVEVVSEKGTGSTFSFTVPGEVKPSKTVSIPTTIASDEKNARPLILIAEDEDSNYRLMEIILKSSYEIVRAESGLEAVELCRSRPGIRLVLMDIKMPVMNGLEATRQIRQFNSDICIIAQTAYGLIGDREKAMEAGCNDYILKPIAKEKLLTLLQERCQFQ
jgi:CheY-like chemotaxis protein/anti-sigma regulatory factor (Ser/Thr protein kinase)